MEEQPQVASTLPPPTISFDEPDGGRHFVELTGFTRLAIKDDVAAFLENGGVAAAIVQIRSEYEDLGTKMPYLGKITPAFNWYAELSSAVAAKAAAQKESKQKSQQEERRTSEKTGDPADNSGA